MSARATQGGSVGGATLWMVVLSVLLFWLPTLGPLVAGFVGGRRAGGVGPALGAAVIPAVIVSALIGEKVGEVADVLLDDGGVVRAYEVKRGLVRDLGGRERVPAGDVVSSGRDAIIVRDHPPGGPESAGRR